MNYCQMITVSVLMLLQLLFVPTSCSSSSTVVQKWDNLKSADAENISISLAKETDGYKVLISIFKTCEDVHTGMILILYFHKTNYSSVNITFGNALYTLSFFEKML